MTPTRIAIPLLAALVMTLFVLGWPAVTASAGQEHVYQDVNQPRYADTDELTADSDLIVVGAVSATTSQTNDRGRLYEEVHQVDVVRTVKGQPPARLQVVQVIGSTDGALHVEGQHELAEGADYVLFLAATGDHYRTVGGAQGVFVPRGPGWVSAAPDRQDLALGPLQETATADQWTVIQTPAVTRAPTTSSTPDTAVRTAPAATPALDAPRDDEGMPWLLGVVFLGGLALGAVAAVGLVRRPATPRQQALPHEASYSELATRTTEVRAAQPRFPDRAPSESPEAAVQGLIAVADLTDSPVLLAQVKRSLRQVGVTMVTAEEGQPFDAEWHHGLGMLPAPRPDLDLSVARVVRPGWRSADRLLRPVEVEVYRTDIP